MYFCTDRTGVSLAICRSDVSIGKYGCSDVIVSGPTIVTARTPAILVHRTQVNTTRTFFPVKKARTDAIQVFRWCNCERMRRP